MTARSAFVGEIYVGIYFGDGRHGDDGSVDALNMVAEIVDGVAIAADTVITGLEKYPGRFIGIGAHCNDPMDAKQYAGNNYQEQFAMIPAYPSARYNRIGSYGNSINDFGDHVESIYIDMSESCPPLTSVTETVTGRSCPYS